MMRPGSLIRSSLLIVLCGVFTQAFAQRFEVYPYYGYASPTKLFGLEFKNSGVFGVKAGMITGSGWEVEGNLGRMSRFELEGMTRQIKALRWEGIGTYNFSPTGEERLVPFVSVGLGGYTMDVSDNAAGDRVVFAALNQQARVPGRPIVDNSQTLAFEDGKTFLSLSYGGGVKFHRLWGPLGARFDAGGTMLPNFFGHVVNSFEASGGVLISWGER